MSYASDAYEEYDPSAPAEVVRPTHVPDDEEAAAHEVLAQSQIDAARQALSAIPLHATAVIVLRSTDDTAWDEDTVAALRGMVRPEVLIVNLAGSDSLEVLDEDAMAKLGWMRIPESVRGPVEG